MVVWGRLGSRGVALLDDLLARPAIEQVAPDDALGQVAFRAFLSYGKGSGHAAGLNFGDLFAYALARERSAPLLWKGRDFGETDVLCALDIWRQRVTGPSR